MKWGDRELKDLSSDELHTILNSFRNMEVEYLGRLRALDTKTKKIKIMPTIGRSFVNLQAQIQTEIDSRKQKEWI